MIKKIILILMAAVSIVLICSFTSANEIEPEVSLTTEFKEYSIDTDIINVELKNNTGKHLECPLNYLEDMYIEEYNNGSWSKLPNTVIEIWLAIDNRIIMFADEDEARLFASETGLSDVSYSNIVRLEFNLSEYEIKNNSKYRLVKSYEITEEDGTITHGAATAEFTVK